MDFGAAPVRLQLVIAVESVSELHRPRWEHHPTRPPQRQLHIGFDGLGGQRLHVILAADVAAELFELIRAIISEDRSDI
jgi:hypothetical protein